MKTRKTKWIVMLALVLRLGLTASAWGGGCYGGLWGGSPLTPNQSTQLFNLKQKFYNDTTDLRRQMVQKRAELAALWQASPPDQAKIAAKQKGLTAIRDKLQEKGLEFQMQARKIAPGAVLGPGMGGKWGMARFWQGNPRARSLTPRQAGRKRQPSFPPAGISPKPGLSPLHHHREGP